MPRFPALSLEEEYFVLNHVLAPPLPLLLARDRVDTPRDEGDGRGGSVSGRLSRKWRSTHWRDNLHKLDARQWRKSFRVNRATYRFLVARVGERIRRPGRNGMGKYKVQSRLV